MDLLRSSTFAIFFSLALSACDRASTDPVAGRLVQDSVDEERAAIVGAAAAKALMESLGSQLKAAMANGGPVSAIGVCRQVAMPLTTATGESFEGVTLRRITLKPRNPANAPDEVDRTVLEAMASQSHPGVAIRREGEIIRYYQPLMVQEICLKCHGDAATFPKELVEVLSASYPQDLATGYGLGDLRGAIRVDIAAP